ncbi:MAG: RNA polymerase sigma factor [Microthrixaceae bacterium]
MDPLVERARDGDREALESVLREHATGVLAVCRRLCADRGDAEDAAQEALLAIARGIGRFDGRSSLSTWIYRVTTNCCMDELRRRRRRPEPVDDHSERAGHLRTEPALANQGSVDPESVALQSELRAELAAALESLPEEFRVVVVLRDVADLDYRAIADILDVPVGTVRSRIARGRDRLAKLLGARDEQPDLPAGTESTPRPSDTTDDRRAGAGLDSNTPGDPPEMR